MIDFTYGNRYRLAHMQRGVLNEAGTAIVGPLTSAPIATSDAWPGREGQPPINR